MKQKIAIVGYIGGGATTVAHRIGEQLGMSVDVVSPESVQNPFGPPPMIIRAPEIIEMPYSPPLTRKERRAKARKSKK